MSVNWEDYVSPNYSEDPRVGLIIGHTTDVRTTVWVRGDQRLRWARIGIEGRPPVDDLELLPDRGYTAIATVRELKASTEYRVVARFAESRAGLDHPPLERRGSFRTFPDEQTLPRFTFLFGSCHLPAARLMSLYSLVSGLLGTSAVRRSLNRPIDTWYWPPSYWPAPVVRWTRQALKLAGRGLATGLVWAVQGLTRFQLPQAEAPQEGNAPEPDLPSPFRALLEQLNGRQEPPAFMIHAGDQIYFDLDMPQRAPTVEEYRRAFVQAWFEDAATRDFLGSLPHYMILDDHEIDDSFENPGRSVPRRQAASVHRQRNAALEAYRQFVHQRQPGGERRNGPLYYQFRYGRAFFFVLDTRSERYRSRSEMVSGRQLDVLLAWLTEHRDDLAFVVSSVPFVAELRPPDPNRHEWSEQYDKWCGTDFKPQRDRILEKIHELSMKRVVFLVGDMHCAYHAMMRVGPPRDRVVIHELAGGPIHQVEFALRGRFWPRHRSTTSGGLPCMSLLRSFEGGAASVTRVTVDPSRSLELRWETVGTRLLSRSQRRRALESLGGRISLSGATDARRTV